MSFKKILIGLGAGIILFSIASPSLVYAEESSTDSSDSSTQATGTGGGAVESAKSGLNALGGKSEDASSIVKKVIDFLLFLIGVIAVIMVIYGGIQYALSAGDPNKVSKAKNTIVYAVIGIVVAMLAFAIVNFVVDQFNKGTSTSSDDSTAEVSKPASSSKSKSKTSEE